MDIDHKKYKWFFTKSGKLIVGGKSAVQNDDLIHLLKENGKDFIVMHTSSPGSPFSAIISQISKVNASDLEETAVFTACFSKAWKEGKDHISVDIFKLSDLHKKKGMGVGTWGIKSKPQRMKVLPHLVLTIQKGVLRAVPAKSVGKKNEILLKISPGKIDKRIILPKLVLELGDSFSQDEILSALPSGGIKISK